MPVPVYPNRGADVAATLADHCWNSSVRSPSWGGVPPPGCDQGAGQPPVDGAGEEDVSIPLPEGRRECPEIAQV